MDRETDICDCRVAFVTENLNNNEHQFNFFCLCLKCECEEDDYSGVCLSYSLCQDYKVSTSLSIKKINKIETLKSCDSSS